MSDAFAVNSTRVNFGDAVLKLFYISTQSVPHAPDRISPLYHGHYYYECHLVTSGSGYIAMDDHSVSLSAGELLIIAPNSEHFQFCATAPEAETHVLALQLEEAEGNTGFFKYFQSSLQEAADHPILLPAALVRLYSSFCASFTLSEASLGDICRQQTAAYELMTALFQHLNDFQAPVLAQYDLLEQDNKEITLETLLYSMDYSLAAIAEKLGYSVRHTARLIRKNYGCNYRELRQRCMVASAKNLLTVQPTLSLEKVALQSGFSNVHTMNRVFLKQEGCYAADYRKKQGERRQDT